ncbi:MAG: GtrA family protein [Sphingomonadales bacterium]|nr:GtrA family protein [Sphingomonadales bacterium]
MERTLSSALDLWHRFTITRYLVASIIALAFDVAIFSSAVALHMQAAYASAIGYCAGIIVHWMVSANFVFTGKTREGGALHWQRILFAGSALLGLGITVATVFLLTEIGVHAVAAKGAAVAISFVAVYAARKWGVFR